MKLLFMGTPGIAVPSLKALVESGKNEVKVVTRIDSKKGRGLKVSSSPVKEYALSKGLEVIQPVSVNEEGFLERIEKEKFDLCVVVSFGQIMPERLIKAPARGSINSHFSLLPKLRGAAPINRALMNGDTVTGVTVQYIELKLDSGDVILQSEENIHPEDDAGSLAERLSLLSAGMLAEAVTLIESGRAGRVKQNDTDATKAPKILNKDAIMDWRKSAAELHNFVRGLSPAPGAMTCFNGKILKILKTGVFSSAEKTEPGKIIGFEKGLGLVVAAGSGSLCIKELQPEGKKQMPAEDFVRGHKNILSSSFTGRL
ncbi:MAG: methionyl-tRNA formyltransferase [Candidatus Firestonebacteria bacterium]